MNKDRVLKLSKEKGAAVVDSDQEQIAIVFFVDELIAFANACEKIGMEKAANILMDETKWHWHPRKFAESIRRNYLTSEIDTDIKTEEYLKWLNAMRKLIT